jgi:hypothetical protein
MYPRPPFGRPVRVAFVGQRTYFEQCALAEPAGGLEPVFIDFRGGANVGEMLSELRAADPHAVVVFRPEIVPAGLLADVPAPVVGYVTEPLPREDEAVNENLEWNLAALDDADGSGFDRVICFDPYGFQAAASRLPAWRCMPLPVADRFYRPVTRARRPPRVVFIGYSTMHREQFLISLKHEFDIGHYAHGLMGGALDQVLADADVGINLHGHPSPPSFENRVLLHLAAGHLVLSERLDPTFGLEPGIDYVEIEGADDLSLRVHQLHLQPDAYDRVRVRGRAKAEQFRASVVWPAVIADLFDDLAAFGTERPSPVSSPA